MHGSMYKTVSYPLLEQSVKFTEFSLCPDMKKDMWMGRDWVGFVFSQDVHTLLLEYWYVKKRLAFMEVVNTPHDSNGICLLMVLRANSAVWGKAVDRSIVAGSCCGQSRGFVHTNIHTNWHTRIHVYISYHCIGSHCPAPPALPPPGHSGSLSPSTLPTYTSCFISIEFFGFQVTTVGGSWLTPTEDNQASWTRFLLSLNCVACILNQGLECSLNWAVWSCVDRLFFMLEELHERLEEVSIFIFSLHRVCTHCNDLSIDPQASCMLQKTGFHVLPNTEELQLWSSWATALALCEVRSKNLLSIGLTSCTGRQCMFPLQTRPTSWDKLSSSVQWLSCISLL